MDTILFSMTPLFKSSTIDHLLSFILDKGIKLLFIVILFVLLNAIGTLIIEKAFKNYAKASHSEETRLLTLEKLTLNIFKYTVFFFIVYSILSLFGIPVGSLIAGAGIIGIAIGLGAQGFINDFITGFFIILERQIEVGDYVSINNIQGTVEVVGLRTTQIKSPDGTLNFIPNRSITTVSNSSRKDMRVLIDIHVRPDIDIVLANKVLLDTTQQHLSDYQQWITAEPQVLGLTTANNGQYVLRVEMLAKNGKQAYIQREFLALYLDALQQAHIPVLSSPIILTTAS